VAAARSADAGELARLGRRLAPRTLAECVTKAARPRRLACLEASGFAGLDVALLGALAESLTAPDRAVAVSAGAALERLVDPERLAQAELGPSELAGVKEALLHAANDARLAPDVRAAALHGLGPLHLAAAQAEGALSDPDAVVRREAVAALGVDRANARALAAMASEDSDPAVAAAAAAATCEAGPVPREVQARVARWLAGADLGPASLAPLLGCARAHPDRALGAWLEAAARSPRPDVRALLSPQSP